MKIYGIDSGLLGAIAVCKDDEFFVCDTPIIKLEKNEYDIRAMADLIEEGSTVYIERIRSMPSQSSIATFRQGEGYGIWLGILYTKKCSIYQFTPQSWKKHFNLARGKEESSSQFKEKSRLKAIEHFPSVYEELKLKKNENRGEALLILEYGMVRL